MENTTLQVGTKALIYNKSHQFLLIKRSEKYGYLAGQWDIPGGRIRPGTDLLTNLAREVKEETNLVIYDQPILLTAQDIITKTNRHIVRLTYLAQARGEISIQDEEVTEYQWCSQLEVAKLNNLDSYIKEVFDKMPQSLYHLLQSEYVKR
jgi:ADP-ribose pyrophosphatase YjhB (NUDIX family)